MPSENKGAERPVTTRPPMPAGAGGALPHGAEAGRHPLDRLVRELSLTGATMLVVSSVIGVGVFLAPGRVAQVLPPPVLFLAACVGGGLLSLAEALANASLGVMYPHAGGDYVCLRQACHPLAGFLVG